jgi:hypothetical protein
VAIRKAGQNRDVEALLAMGLLGAAGLGTQGYGIYDLFTGETHGMNSGEIPMNWALSGVPGLTAVAGAGLGGVITPAARLQQQAALMEIMRAQGVEPPMEVKREFTQAAAAQTARVQSQAKEGMSQAEAMEILRQRGARASRIGAVTGAMAGAIPAILAMRDQSAAQG